MEDWEQYRAWRLLKESEFTCLSFSQLIRCEILLKRPIVIAAAHGVKWGIKISTFYSNLRWCIGTSSFINVNFRISSEVPWCKSSIASWNEDSGSKRDQRALSSIFFILKLSVKENLTEKPYIPWLGLIVMWNFLSLVAAWLYSERDIERCLRALTDWKSPS